MYEALFDTDELETGQPAVERRSVDGALLTNYLERPSPWARIIRWGVGLLLLAAIAQEGLGVYYDRQLTAVAREVTGQDDLKVNCRRVWDELLFIKANPGFVEWGSDTANLQFPVCMDALRYRDDPNDESARLGVMILTHEMAHLAGHRNESATECVAMWALPKTAVALGRSTTEGELAANWYASEYNPHLRGDYQAPGCLSGPAPASQLLR